MTSYNKRHEGKGVANYFPIKQVRVDVTKHPIVIAGDKAFSKATTLVSKQEEQMLAGIATSLQVPVSMALRIAIYEACKAPDEARLMLSLADPMSRAKAHLGRNTSIAHPVAKADRDRLQSLAKKLKVSEKVALRVVIIFVAKGLKDTMKITKSRYLTQAECASQWRGNKRRDGSWVKGKQSALEPLREANEEAMDAAQEQNDLLYEKRKFFVQAYTDMGMGWKVWDTDGINDFWNTEAIDDIIYRHETSMKLNQLDAALKAADTQDEYNDLLLTYWPEIYDIPQKEVQYFINTGEWSSEAYELLKELVDSVLDEETASLEDLQRQHFEDIDRPFEGGEEKTQIFLQKNPVEQIDEIRQVTGSAFCQVVARLDKDYWVHLTPEELAQVKDHIKRQEGQQSKRASYRRGA